MIQEAGENFVIDLNYQGIRQKRTSLDPFTIGLSEDGHVWECDMLNSVPQELVDLIGNEIEHYTNN